MGTGAVVRLRQINSEVTKQNDDISRFCREQHISGRLTAKVITYVTLQRKRNMRMIQECEVTAFECIPISLIRKLRTQMYGPTLRWHPLFERIFERGKLLMSDICSNGTQHVSWGMEEQIFVTRSHCQRMVFVATGTAEYLPSQEGIPA